MDVVLSIANQISVLSNNNLKIFRSKNKMPINSENHVQESMNKINYERKIVQTWTKDVFLPPDANILPGTRL